MQPAQPDPIPSFVDLRPPRKLGKSVGVSDPFGPPISQEQLARDIKTFAGVLEGPDTTASPASLDVSPPPSAEPMPAYTESWVATHALAKLWRTTPNSCATFWDFVHALKRREELHEFAKTHEMDAWLLEQITECEARLSARPTPLETGSGNVEIPLVIEEDAEPVIDENTLIDSDGNILESDAYDWED